MQPHGIGERAGGSVIVSVAIVVDAEADKVMDWMPLLPVRN